MDYKAIDTRRIIDYIYSFPGLVIGVEDIIQNAGADKLRVYPALFELEQAGYIEVVEREGTRSAVGGTQEKRHFTSSA